MWLGMMLGSNLTSIVNAVNAITGHRYVIGTPASSKKTLKNKKDCLGLDCNLTFFWRFI
jgi:hypothetical protein